MKALLGKKGNTTLWESNSCTQEEQDQDRNAVQTIHLRMPAALSNPQFILFSIKCQPPFETLTDVCLL